MRRGSLTGTFLRSKEFITSTINRICRRWQSRKRLWMISSRFSLILILLIARWVKKVKWEKALHFGQPWCGPVSSPAVISRWVMFLNAELFRSSKLRPSRLVDNLLRDNTSKAGRNSRVGIRVHKARLPTLWQASKFLIRKSRFRKGPPRKRCFTKGPKYSKEIAGVWSLRGRGGKSEDSAVW